MAQGCVLSIQMGERFLGQEGGGPLRCKPLLFTDGEFGAEEASWSPSPVSGIPGLLPPDSEAGAVTLVLASVGLSPMPNSREDSG